MTNETRPEQTSVLIGNQAVNILALGGKAFREGVQAQLGKRLSCAQEITVKTTRQVKDPKTGEQTTQKVDEVRYVDGQVPTDTGGTVYLGCGTEILCLKKSEDIILCCGFPMTIKSPQVLPSAD